MSDVRIFSHNGKYLKTVGRKGQGPGEFQFPKDIIILKGIGFAVSDPTQYRVTIFDYSGKFLRSFRRDSRHPAVAIQITPNKDILISSIIPWNEKEKSEFKIRKYDIYGKNSNVIFSIEKEALPRSLFSSNKSIETDPKLFYSWFWQVDSKGNIYLVENCYDYLIKVYTPEGKHYKSIHKEFKLLKISKHEIDDNQKESEEWAKKTLGRKIPGPFCKYQQVIKEIFIDNFDQIWMRTLSTDSDSSIIFDIFDKNGKYISKASLNCKSGRHFKIRNNALYFRKTDENGVHSLIRYKIIKK